MKMKTKKEMEKIVEEFVTHICEGGDVHYLTRFEDDDQDFRIGFPYIKKNKTNKKYVVVFTSLEDIEKYKEMAHVPNAEFFDPFYLIGNKINDILYFLVMFVAFGVEYVGIFKYDGSVTGYEIFSLIFDLLDLEKS